MINTSKINACSGGIYKTYKESFFIQFQLYSKIGDVLFNRERHYGNYDWEEKEYGNLVILQMLICNETEILAEVIKYEDFNNYFPSGERECEQDD